MKRSLKELLHYSIQAKDIKKGTVKDFLLNENPLTVRYLEADLGSLFSSEKKVLIPRGVLGKPMWEKSKFPVNITEEQIKNCPKPEDNMPISRKFEMALNNYYRIDNYWLDPLLMPVSNYGYIHKDEPEAILTKAQIKNDLGASLRSFKEILGYKIRSNDNKSGHVEDLIIDDLTWQVAYLVIDTKDWNPFSKKVILSIHHVDEISYLDQEMSVNLSSETIKSAPEFDPSVPINEVYEKKLFDFYGRPVEKL